MRNKAAVVAVSSQSEGSPPSKSTESGKAYSKYIFQAESGNNGQSRDTSPTDQSNRAKVPKGGRRITQKPETQVKTCTGSSGNALKNTRQSGREKQETSVLNPKQEDRPDTRGAVSASGGNPPEGTGEAGCNRQPSK